MLFPHDSNYWTNIIVIVQIIGRKLALKSFESPTGVKLTINSVKKDPNYERYRVLLWSNERTFISRASKIVDYIRLLAAVANNFFYDVELSIERQQVYPQIADYLAIFDKMYLATSKRL